jgi:hypothetical protein
VSFGPYELTANGPRERPARDLEKQPMRLTYVSSLMRSLRSPRRRSCLAFAVLGLAAGCSNADAARKVTVYPVKGKVLLPGGKPLASGRVVFLPLGEPVMESSGAIKPDGTFSLNTGESGEGAPAGEYRVRIEPEDAQIPSGKPGARPGTRPTYPFPGRYADEETSNLKVTVQPGPNELPPFRLEPAARTAMTLRHRN